MKYRTGVEGGKEEERDGGLSGQCVCQGPMAGSVLPVQIDTLLKIKAPKGGFHSYAIEEPVLVPQITFQSTDITFF